MVLLLGRYVNDFKTGSQKVIWAPMLTTALLTIANCEELKQPPYSLTHECSQVWWHTSVTPAPRREAEIGMVQI